MPKLYATRYSTLQQKGGTILTLLIFLMSGMVMSLGWVHHQILFSQQSAQNDAMRSQAMALAETGFSWAQAYLNSAHSAARSLCSFSPGQPTLRAQAGHFLACQHQASSWSCQCGQYLALENLPSNPGPSFLIELLPSQMQRSIKVRSRACVEGGVACLNQAQAELHQTWSLMGGLHHMPNAALLALGSVHISGSSDPIHGNNITNFFKYPLMSQPVKQSSELFKFMFGFDQHEWQTQTSLRTLDCEAPCSDNLTKNLADPSVTMIHLSKLHIDSPITLGSADRPVLLVVDGLAQLNAPTTLYGLLYAGRITSKAPESTLQIHGALVSETEITLEARPMLHFDPLLLQKLQNSTGSYIRMPATWTDL